MRTSALFLAASMAPAALCAPIVLASLQGIPITSSAHAQAITPAAATVTTSTPKTMAEVFHLPSRPSLELIMSVLKGQHIHHLSPAQQNPKAEITTTTTSSAPAEGQPMQHGMSMVIVKTERKVSMPCHMARVAREHNDKLVVCLVFAFFLVVVGAEVGGLLYSRLVTPDSVRDDVSGRIVSANIPPSLRKKEGAIRLDAAAVDSATSLSVQSESRAETDEKTAI
jgi:hypothetical protein